MAWRSALLAVGGALASMMSVAGGARAGCNAIPDAHSVKTLQPAVPGLIGFKGALGRVDRLYLLPGDNPSFRVQSDGICVNGEGAEPLVRSLSGDIDIENYTVTLRVKPATGDAFVRVLGTQKSCERFMSNQVVKTEAETMVRCDALALQVERDQGRLNVRVPLPGDGNLFPAALVQRGPQSGRVTIIVTRTPDDAAKHDALLRQISADGCAKHCGELLQADALACIDQIYSRAQDGTFRSDPIPCNVGTATVAKNDFREQCEETQLHPDLADCNANATHLTFWQDGCGGIHIPFDWKEIRKDTAGNAIARLVAGRSGTSRAKSHDSRVWIPGREFLGSTPYADPQGTQSTTDWRFPDVNVWYPDEPSEAIGLRGSTDQDDSIVHVFPRMPVWLVCNGVAGDEACEGVEGLVHGESLDCACQDRYAPGCTCKQLRSARYFACDGGDFDGMPCTRSRHCNSQAGGKPNGKCSGQPSCQPRSEEGVWKPGRDHKTGKKCWDDTECATVGPDHRCGYRLFDFDDRQQNGIIEMDAQIEDTPGAREGRGACKKNPKRSCSNLQSNKKPCPSGDGNCTGYTLQAEGRR